MRPRYTIPALAGNSVYVQRGWMQLGIVHLVIAVVSMGCGALEGTGGDKVGGVEGRCCGQAGSRQERGEQAPPEHFFIQTSLGLSCRTL